MLNIKEIKCEIKSITHQNQKDRIKIRSSIFVKNQMNHTEMVNTSIDFYSHPYFECWDNSNT